MTRNKVIHKDLKPENILVHTRQKGAYDVRIADFGYSCFADEMVVTPGNKEATLICGTGGYIAPESLDG